MSEENKIEFTCNYSEPAVHDYQIKGLIKVTEHIETRVQKLEKNEVETKTEMNEFRNKLNDIEREQLKQNTLILETSRETNKKIDSFTESNERLTGKVLDILEGKIKADINIKSETTKQKFTFWTAIVSGMIGLGSLLINYFIKQGG